MDMKTEIQKALEELGVHRYCSYDEMDMLIIAINFKHSDEWRAIRVR